MPTPGETVQRCDCEHSGCKHRAGGCAIGATVRVVVFGITEKLCPSCYNELVNFAHADISKVERLS